MDIDSPFAYLPNSSNSSNNPNLNLTSGNIIMNEREQKQEQDLTSLLKRSNSLRTLPPSLSTSNLTNQKAQQKRRPGSNTSSSSSHLETKTTAKNNKVRKNPRQNQRKSKRVREAETLAAVAAIVASMGVEAELVACFKGVGLENGIDEGVLEGLELDGGFGAVEMEGMLWRGIERKMVGEREGGDEEMVEVEVSGDGDGGMECDV